MFRPRRIIIHHSATEDSGTVSWGAIRRYHTSHRVGGVIVTPQEAQRRQAAGEHVIAPWSDVGYHAGVELVKSGGRVEYECLFGRPTTVMGAHAGTEVNLDSLGLVFVGNYDLVPPPLEMLEAAASRVLRPWMAQFRIDVRHVQAHRDFSAKSCPGRLFDMDKLRGLLGS